MQVDLARREAFREVDGIAGLVVVDNRIADVDAAGAPLLLSNEMAQGGQPANLSFEREFGKMIGNLDILSVLLAEKGHRIIARVVQNFATAVFLPVRGL